MDDERVDYWPKYGLVSRLRDDEGSEGALAEQIESEGFSERVKDGRWCLIWRETDDPRGKVWFSHSRIMDDEDLIAMLQSVVRTVDMAGKDC